MTSLLIHDSSFYKELDEFLSFRRESSLERSRINIPSIWFVFMCMYRQVPNHCRAYALSYHTDPDYVSPCDHEHDLACDRCEVFPNVVHEVESALENAEISSDDKDEMKYVVFLAKKRSMEGSFTQINQPR